MDLRGCVLIAGLAGAACFTDTGGSACPDGKCSGDPGTTAPVDPSTGPGSTSTGSTGATTEVVEPSTTASTTSDTTAVDPTTGVDTDPTSTSEASVGDDTSTGDPLLCGEVHHLMLEVADADTAMGNIDVVDGEPFLDLGSAGTAAWKVALPCQAEWRLWVRGYVFPLGRSYGFSVVGDPSAFVFDVACENPNEGGAAWDVLNVRPAAESVCKPQADPLLYDGGPDGLELLFGYVDTPYLGRLVLTNDPDFVPQ